MPQRAHVWCGTYELLASTVQDARWFLEKMISENKKQQRGGFYRRWTSTMGTKGKKTLFFHISESLIIQLSLNLCKDNSC